MPSFGKNVWLVDNGKKSIQSLDYLESFEMIETKFLQKKQQQKISEKECST